MEKYILDEETLVEKKKRKKKKPYDSMYFTTGDPAYNIAQFNKHAGSDGYLNGTIKAAEVTQVGVSPDGGNCVSSSALSSGDASSAGGCCEGLELNEAKRYVRRYYIRPQNMFCSNKADIIKALIEIGDQNCTIYTLIDVGYKHTDKLTNKDIIYYYDDGILYDKNHVKVMDYDLYIKHEEKRDKINPATTSDRKFGEIYDDRITEITKDDDEVKENLESELSLEFPVLTEDLDEEICCICGEKINGYGNNPYPVKEEGRCCDACNIKFVIPARLEAIEKE